MMSGIQLFSAIIIACGNVNVADAAVTLQELSKLKNPQLERTRYTYSHPLRIMIMPEFFGSA